MHLGDEVRVLKWVILGPYTAFIIYLIYMTTIMEGNYSSKLKDLIDPLWKQHEQPAKTSHE
jgi:hypothetical protein